MKKGVGFFQSFKIKAFASFFLFLSFIFFFLYVASAETITGSTVTGQSITGNATSASVAVSVTVVGSPAISLLRPVNQTYFSNKNLELNFSISNADLIWYNLDNGSNTTITGNTTFNTTSGTHTIYLWAKNAYGNASKNVVFTVNLTKFTVIYSNFSGSTKGASTYFNASSFEEIQNLSSVILENTNFGKILFNQAINLTNDSSPTDETANLDGNLNISQNFISINTTALPNFNKSATLYLYNLTFSNPRVLRNGEVCGSEICTEVSYSGGTFVFNVTQFSNYSAEETPSQETTSSGGGGGGGRGTAITEQKPPSFILDREQIFVSLNPGQVKTEYITITNTGEKTAIFKIENFFQEFVLRGKEEIILNPGESEAIPLHVLARVDTIPDFYLGKIVISGNNEKKEIFVAVEVESEGILLDVKAEILGSHKEILSGEELISEITLFNLGGKEGRKDIEVEYSVRNTENKEIFKLHESLAIETQLTFIKRIKIPNNAELGRHILYVKAVYDGKTASSSDFFDIVSTKVTDNEKIYIVTIIILIALLGTLLYYLKTHKRHIEKEVRKIELRHMLKQ